MQVSPPPQGFAGMRKGSQGSAGSRCTIWEARCTLVQERGLEGSVGTAFDTEMCYRVCPWTCSLHPSPLGPCGCGLLACRRW